VSDFPDRLPPSDPDAEMAVLGSMLIDNPCIGIVRQRVKAEDFYSPDHQEIFRAISALSEERVPVDLVLLTQRLREHGVLERMGGNAPLLDMLDKVPSAANAEHYADIVARLAFRRKLIRAGMELSRNAYSDIEPHQERAADAEGAIRDARIAAQPASAGTLADQVASAKRMMAWEGDCWPSSIAPLDGFIGGLRGGTSVVIGGRSRHCKTAISVAFIEATLDVDKAAHNYRYEEIPESILFRLASRKSGIAYADVQMRRTSPESNAIFAQWLDWIGAEWREGLTIRTGQRIEDIEACVERDKPALVVVDTIQKMAHAHSKGSDRRHDLLVGSLTSRLAQLAMRTRACVVILSQVNRKSDRQAMPTLGDLRETGAIAEDADTVLLGWWPKIDMPDKAQKGNDDFCTGYVLDVAKNRIGGRVGRLYLRIAEGTQALEQMPLSQEQHFRQEAHV